MFFFVCPSLVYSFTTFIEPFFQDGLIHIIHIPMFTPPPVWQFWSNRLLEISKNHLSMAAWKRKNDYILQNLVMLGSIHFLAKRLGIMMMTWFWDMWPRSHHQVILLALGILFFFCILWGSESFEDQIALMKFAPFTHLIPLLYGRLPLTVDVFLNDSMCPFFHAAKRWRGILTRDQEW